MRWQPAEKRLRLDEFISTYASYNAEDAALPEAMQIDDNEIQGAEGSQATASAEYPSLQSPGEESLRLDDKQLDRELLSPLSKAAEFESHVAIVNDMYLSDANERFSSDSDSFDEYDPYFDTLEVRRAKT